jgi:phosphate transport system substrate-binding protein
MRKLVYILVATLLVALTLAAGATRITIKGSDTLVRLGQRWAEEYMNQRDDVIIQVSGGGSVTGVAALINGTTDICEASRDMRPREYALARRNGVDPYRVAVALDGVAVFLNRENPVDELTIEQLKDIYTGVVENWQALGGPDHQIVLYGRENNSYTYLFFKEHVMDGEDYAVETQTLPGTAAVVNAVAKDRYGIGYGGLAWARGVKFAQVRMGPEAPAIAPDAETVANGSYPISRELYWFFDGQPKGVLRELTNWVLSEEGQEIAVQMGYVPLSPEQAEANMIE